MTQLTEHFSEQELGVEFADERVKENARYLCEQILEPIRAHYATAIRVNSGYRPPAHNKEVGGKPTSYHLYDDGRAAVDVSVPGVAITQVFTWLRMASDLPFDKVILEYTGDIPEIVHVQVDRTNTPRRLAYVGSTGDGHNYIPQEVAPANAEKVGEANGLKNGGPA
jgi:hypothetical protein